MEVNDALEVAPVGDRLATVAHAQHQAEAGVRILEAVLTVFGEQGSEVFAVLSAEATQTDHPANSYMRRRYHWVSEIFS